jgi:hypothetical protein
MIESVLSPSNGRKTLSADLFVEPRPFGTQIPERQIERRGVGRVPVPLQLVAPATPLTKSRELVLANDVCGEAIGVRCCLSLRIGEEVHFAMGLLERLADFMFFKPFSPGQDLAGGRIVGMPNRHAGIVGKSFDRLALLIHQAVSRPDAVRPAGFQYKRPDNPSGQRADNRMIEVTISEVGERPCSLLQKQSFEPIAISRQEFHAAARCRSVPPRSCSGACSAAAAPLP